MGMFKGLFIISTNPFMYDSISCFPCVFGLTMSITIWGNILLCETKVGYKIKRFMSHKKNMVYQLHVDAILSNIIVRCDVKVSYVTYS